MFKYSQRKKLANAYKLGIKISSDKKQTERIPKKEIILPHSGYKVSFSVPESNELDDILDNLKIYTSYPSWEYLQGFNDSLGVLTFKENLQRRSDVLPCVPGISNLKFQRVRKFSDIFTDSDICLEVQRRVKGYLCMLELNLNQVSYSYKFFKSINHEIKTRMEFFDMTSEYREKIFNWCYTDRLDLISDARETMIKEILTQKDTTTPGPLAISIHGAVICVAMSVIHESHQSFIFDDALYGIEKRNPGSK